jgi:hypothetical protein
MTEVEIRKDLIRKITLILYRLPNGLLHRLLADAEFFEAWNLKKKRARGSSRMLQHKAAVARLEERYWSRINREGASRTK